jgi:ankyrin repeat protein
MRRKRAQGTFVLTAAVVLTTWALPGARSAPISDAGTHVAPREPTEGTQPYDPNELMLAAMKGDPSAVQTVLARGTPVNAKDVYGMTALMWAAPQVVPLLLKRGADVRVRDYFDRTALHFAACTDSPAVVRALLDRGLNVNERDAQGWTPLLYAVEGACHVAWTGRCGPREQVLIDLLMARRRVGFGAEAARVLLERGADPNARNTMEWTALTSALEYGATVQNPLVQVLLSHGADVNARSKFGDPALLLAARGGDAPTLKRLLELGADVNAQDQKGSTALSYVARNGHLDAVNLLLARGATIDGRSRTRPLATQSRRTPLMAAASGGHREIVQVLLDHKADLQARDEDGWSALVWAAVGGDLPTVKLLLDAGADVHVRSRKDEGILALVRGSGRADHSAMIRLLTEAGARE